MKTLIHCSFIFLCFALTALNHAHAQKLKVALIPIGKLNPEHTAIIEKSLESYYEMKVSVSTVEIPLNPALLSTATFAPSPIPINVLNADSTNSKLLQLGLSKYDMLIGVTDSALTIGNVLLASSMQNLGKVLIQGFSESSLQVATISTYKLKKEAKNEQTFREDLSKIARHEIGHLLGVQHCTKNKDCLMLNAKQFNNSTEFFCEYCLEKIDKKCLKKDKQPVFTSSKATH